jgi:hypothetical protein
VLLGAGGGRIALASEAPRGLGAVTAGSAAAAAAAAGKRKPEAGSKGGAEAEALARREAARKRVAERTLGQFGLS